MATPTSPSNGQPSSFKTNINRAKTKRWVEAKSYSYDGDDWGDSGDEEYDNPETSSQPPQGIPPRQTGFSGPYPQPADRGRYGDFALPQGPSQAPRGVSNPASRTSPSRQSIDRGGDRRTYSLNSQSGFSDGPYPGPNRPPFAPSDHFGPPRMGPPRSPRNQSPLRVDTGQRRPSMTHDPYPHAPFMPDPSARRSSSPFRPDSRGGAYPDVRGGPYPQPRPVPYGEPRGRPFPGPPPPQGRRSESRGRPSPAELMGRRESPGPGRPPFGPPHGGPPPGFRPSMENSRDASPARSFAPRKSSLSQEQPPFDPSAMNRAGSTGPDEPQSDSKPAKALPFIRPADIYRRMEEEREKERRQSQESSRPSTDVPTPKAQDATPSLGHRTSGENMNRTPAKPDSEAAESDNSRRLKPMLEPVSERKSEYGSGNVLKDAPPEHPSSTSQSQTQPQSQPLSREPSQPLSASSTYTDRPDPISASSSKRSYRGLPEVGRVSEFGDEFFSQSDEGPYSAAQQTPRSADPDRFNRAVNQAFDQSQNLNPQTSVSSLGDSVVRSTSENTSDVSPIISRNPSNAAGEIRTTVVQAEPTIAEEPSEATPRPDSSRTLKDPFADQMSKDLPDVPRSTFRRSTDSPSPSRSPARRPQSMGGASIPDTEPVEIVTTAPLDANRGRSSQASTRENIQSARAPNEDLVSPNIPRAESPTKGTVKGLTDRFETSARSSPSSSPERIQETSRPSHARLESFRPSIPGGWSSYTTNEGTATPTSEDQNPTREPTLAELRQQEADKEQWKPNPRLVSHHDEGETEHEPSKTAFAAAAAAGSALAGAFSAVTGSHDRSKTEDESPRTEEPYTESPWEARESESSSSSSEHDIPPAGHLQPVKRDAALQEVASTASSAPPTPPPKDTPMEDSRQVSGDSSYFPSPLRASRTHEENTETPARPHMIPSLSTETSPQDDENDRLRKEIVKSLSPQTIAFDQTQFTDSPTALRAPPENRGQVESTLLPREYDSYWNETETERSQPNDTTEVDLPLANEQRTSQPSEELQTTEQSKTGRTLKKKFSWESSSIEEEPIAESISGPPVESTEIESPWSPNPREEMSNALPTHMQATEGELDPTTHQEHVEEPQETTMSRESFNEEAPSLPAVTVHGPEELGSRDTTPRPVEREIPLQTADITEEQESEPARQLGGDPKIRSFREILALKTTPERINAYNHARGQFASIDTGLTDWMQMVGQQNPEHAHMVANHGRLAPHEVEAMLGHRLSPSRMKFPRIVSLNTAIPQTDDGTESTSSGKMTKEQLLHSAGKFGGIAGGAAKGLFNKGKNKFRGSGGGDKAFFAIRRRSQPAESPQQPEPQPVVVVTEPVPQSGESISPANRDESGSPADEIDTWSLSYAPTERHSSEKPRRSTSGPRELGSLAPPPYQSKTSPEHSARDEPPVPPLPVQIPSPRISAFDIADNNEAREPSPTPSLGDRGEGQRPDEIGAVNETPEAVKTESPSKDSFQGEIEPDKSADRTVAQVDQPRKFSWEVSGASTNANENAVSQITEHPPVEEPTSIETPQPTPQTYEDVPVVHDETKSPAEVSKTHIDTHENPETPAAIENPSDQYDEQPLSYNEPTERPHSGYFGARSAELAHAPMAPRVDKVSPHEVTPNLQQNHQNSPTEMKSEADLPREDVPTAVNDEQSKVLGKCSTEDVAQRFSFDATRDHEDIEKPPYTESPQFQGLIEKDTGLGTASEDPEKPKTKRPPSFSRPFGPPNIREHPAFRASPEPERRSQVYASEDIEQSVYSQDPYMRDSSNLPRLPTSDDEGYRIPGPYGQHFKSRQPPVPPSSYRPPRHYEQAPSPPPPPPPQHPGYRPRHGPERSFDLRPMTTEYTIPGIEPPSPPSVEDPRRRSGILPVRTKPRSPKITADDDSDLMEDVAVNERVKKKPGFLRKNRGVSDSHRTGSAASSNDPKDRLGQMMSPSAVQGYPDNKAKKNKKLKRASISDSPVAEGGKRGSFSRLSGLFSRSRSPKTSAAPVVQSSSNHTNVLTKTERPNVPPQDQYLYQNMPAGDFRGRPPPPGGYYGDTSTMRDEGSVGRNYQSHFQPDRPMHNKQAGPTMPQSSHHQPVQQSGPTYSGPNRPVRVPSYDVNNPSFRPYGHRSDSGSRFDSAQHAIDLHKRSRSPRSGQMPSENEQKDSSPGPAHDLGIFRDGDRMSNNVPDPRNDWHQNGNQEAPWRLDLPGDDRGHDGTYNNHYSNGNDSGVHMNSREGSGDRRSMRNEEGPQRRQASPYSASQHSASRNDQAGSQDDDEDMYNDGGYGPPPRRSKRRSGHHLQPNEGPTNETTDPASRSSSKRGQPQSIREQHHQQALYELQGSRAPGHPESDEEDDIVMSPTSYPGQEWMPVVDFGRTEGLRGWDD